MQSWWWCSGRIFSCAVIADMVLALGRQTWVLAWVAVSSSCRIPGYCAWVVAVAICDIWRCWVFLVAGSCSSCQWRIRLRIFLRRFGFYIVLFLRFYHCTFPSVRIIWAECVIGSCAPLLFLFVFSPVPLLFYRLFLGFLFFWSSLGLSAAICSACYILGWYFLVLSVAW